MAQRTTVIIFSPAVSRNICSSAKKNRESEEVIVVEHQYLQVLQVDRGLGGPRGSTRGPWTSAGHRRECSNTAATSIFVDLFPHFLQEHESRRTDIVLVSLVLVLIATLSS